MSSGGPEMVETSYGWPEVAEKSNLESFSRVLGVQEVFWGLGFPLASQVMFI